jgi:hypothetical protein
MSLRLVDVWLFMDPYHHTAIDDLESFLWLTIWCIYRIIEDKGQLDERGEFALETLRSTSIKKHAGARANLLDRLVKARTLPPLLALFQPLLLQWWRISDEGAQEISNLLKSTTSPENDALRDLTLKYAQEYLSHGFSYLANFPQSWEPFFPPEE